LPNPFVSAKDPQKLSDLFTDKDAKERFDKLES